MIKISNAEVWGFEHATRGMRNALQSWDKSDSDFSGGMINIGENDLDLMRKLFKAGTSHRKFLRQIFVSMDITAPEYWFKQFDTYRVGIVENSTSTMHCIHKKPFTLEDFSYDGITQNGLVALQILIAELNNSRNTYLKEKNKDYWNDLIKLLPMSYNYTRTVTISYENIAAIIAQRSGHKLQEWNDLIKYFWGLPYVYAIMGDHEE